MYPDVHPIWCTVCIQEYASRCRHFTVYMYLSLLYPCVYVSRCISIKVYTSRHLCIKNRCIDINVFTHTDEYITRYVCIKWSTYPDVYTYIYIYKYISSCLCIQVYIYQGVYASRHVCIKASTYPGVNMSSCWHIKVCTHQAVRRRRLTHDVQHDVVSQARGAVDADQDAVLDGAAEPHGQTVRPRAGPIVVGPGVGDQASALPEDVGGASWYREGRNRAQRSAHRSCSLCPRQAQSKRKYYICTTMQLMVCS